MANPLIDHVDSALDKARPDEADGRETIDNRERGCGHLDPNAAYIRCDLAALGSPDGEIPPFVEFDDPVEYREHIGRGAIIPGFKAFPGNSFTLHYAADGGTTTPERDIQDHIARLQMVGFAGDHYADMKSTRAIDILMSVGKTNYETPDDYIDECRNRGLNLKIPVSQNQDPPVVEPLRTRVFIIHPDGCGDGRPGIIGYAYATRTIFTNGTKATDDDPDVPGWAADLATVRDDVDLVDRGEPIADDDDSIDDAQTTIDGVRSFDTDFNADEVVENDPVRVQASDKPGRDVEQADTAATETPIEDVDYNVLKAKASREDDVDVGPNPSKDDLVDALHGVGIDTATVKGGDE